MWPTRWLHRPDNGVALATWPASWLVDHYRRPARTATATLQGRSAHILRPLQPLRRSRRRPPSLGRLFPGCTSVRSPWRRFPYQTRYAARDTLTVSASFVVHPTRRFRSVSNRKWNRPGSETRKHHLCRRARKLDYNRTRETLP